jgi:hypothetical protein
VTFCERYKKGNFDLLDLFFPFSFFSTKKQTMVNYSSIVDNDTSASSISSVPALSVFSEIGASLDERRPLLSNTTVDSNECEHDEPTATIASAAINLSNTILGTGMLAMVKK